MEKMTETLLVRLSPSIKQKLGNDAWLKKMSMAEYLRWLIKNNDGEKK